jgi:hypothetical protein
MTFDQVVTNLKESGITQIMKMKVRMQTYAPPTRPDMAPKEYLSIVDWDRFKLDEGTLAKGEWWIPTGFHGYQSWTPSFCAPHWITSENERSKWMNENTVLFEWPDHGEQSDDPTLFISKELGILKWQFCASEEIKEKHHEKLNETLKKLQKAGSEYLAEAIELALQTEPEHRQVTRQQLLLEDRGIGSYVDKRVIRILELAFRAGRVSERHSTYYRGVPDAAQDGWPMVERIGSNNPRKEWTSHVQALLAKDPKITTQGIAESLKENSLCDWGDLSYKKATTISLLFENEEEDQEMKRKVFQTAISKQRKIAQKKV